MATIGKKDPFNDAEENWSSYVERLENVEMFFMVNSVEDGKRTAALVSLISGKTYGFVEKPNGTGITVKFYFQTVD